MEALPVANLQAVKESNRNKVFRLLFAQGPLSRVELARRAGLSPTTVSSLVAELLAERVVAETGPREARGSGRRPTMLEVSADGRVLAAVGVDASGLSAALLDLRFRPLTARTTSVADFAALGDALADAVAGLLAEAGRDAAALLGICLGVPALLDAENGRILASTVLMLPEGTDAVGRLRERFPGTPVHLENDSALKAYAEQAFGPTGGARNLVFLDVGAGIGAGIILDGRRFTGAYGHAGEIGHMTVDPHGPLCRCGNRGCLEAMAALPALSRAVAGDGTDGPPAEALLQAYRAGDPRVRAVADEGARILARGIDNLVALINPQVVVLGGEAAGFGPDFLAAVRAALRPLALGAGRDRVELRFSEIPGDPVALGGARVVLDRAFGA